MESKPLIIGVTDTADVQPFNRTSMESKHLSSRCTGSPVFLLIEPVWNRNTDNRINDRFLFDF